jgi:hypothetical protein
MSNGLVSLPGANGTGTTVTVARPGGHSTPVTVTITAPATLDHLTYTLSSSTATVGSAAPTGTVSAWQDAGGTVAFTGATSYSYTSSNTGVATIDSSSGVIALVAAGTCTFTVTDGITSKTATTGTLTVSASGGSSFDTTTFDASTGAGIGGSTGTPIAQLWDVYNATRYPDDAHWRAAISNYGAYPSTLGPQFYTAKAGTGSSSAKYNDGSAPDLTDLDGSVQYSGQQTLRCTIHGTGSGVAYPDIGINHVPAGLYSCWMFVRRRYETNFTVVGDGTGVTGDPSYKIGPYMTYSVGRSGLETGNGSGQTAVVDYENDPNVSGTNIGFVHSPVNITTEWTDGLWRDYLVYSEQFTGRDGHVYFGMTTWQRKQGDAAYARWGHRIAESTGFTGSLQPFTEFRPLGKNYNHNRATDLHHNTWGVAAWDPASVPDPMGVLAVDAAATPTACTIGTLVSQTTSSATYPLTIGSFARYVRPVVDGVEQAAQEYDLAGEYGDNATLNITVTGLATGSRTISFNVYNVNKTAHASTGNKTVTI